MAIVDQTTNRVMQATGGPVQVVSCYEAGYDGFWLHRFLAAHRIINHVLDAASLLVNRKARRAKTDRLDAEKLVRVLMAYWRGEPKVCSIVRPPSVEDEDAKRLHRERQFLMKERVQHIGASKVFSRRRVCMTFARSVRIGGTVWPRSGQATAGRCRLGSRPRLIGSANA